MTYADFTESDLGATETTETDVGDITISAKGTKIQDVARQVSGATPPPSRVGSIIPTPILDIIRPPTIARVEATRGLREQSRLQTAKNIANGVHLGDVEIAAILETYFPRREP